MTKSILPAAAGISERIGDKTVSVYVYETLDSTSDECRRRLAAGEERCVVVAGAQTGGRGRSGKSFFSPQGGLYLSAAFPAQPDLTGLTCRAAVIAAQAIERVTGRRCGIKWVNDLYLDGKKVCGILCEAVGDSVIIGVGVNLLPAAVPEELADTVGFLDCGDVREVLAAEIAGELLADSGDRGYMEDYRRLSVVPGRRIRVRIGAREFSARVLEIAADGSLIVDGPNGVETVFCGEIFPEPGERWQSAQ